MMLWEVIKLAIKFEELLAEYCPKNLYIDMFTKYYGEEHKEYIKKRIEDTPVVLVADDMFYFQFQHIFKDRYKTDGAELIRSLKSLSKGNDSKEIIDCLIKNRKELEELGFDVFKIIGKNKLTGKLVLLKSEETKRLMDFVKPPLKSTEDKIDIESIIKFYNVALEEEMVFHPQLEMDEHGQFVVTRKANGLLGSITVPQKKLIYTGDMAILQFMSDLIFMENEIDFFTHNESKYLLKHINNLFGTKYKTLKDLMNDSELALFMDYLKLIRGEVSLLSKRTKRGDIASFVDPKLSKDAYERCLHKFESPIAGFYGALEDGPQEALVSIKLSAKTRRVGSHEFNHVISDNEDGRGVSVYQDEYAGNALNEIINEFLNKRAIESYLKDYNNIGKIRDSGCG